jgi:hypothetical protein
MYVGWNSDPKIGKVDYRTIIPRAWLVEKSSGSLGSYERADFDLFRASAFMKESDLPMVGPSWVPLASSPPPSYCTEGLF